MTLSPQQLERLKRLGDALIPGDDRYPPASEVLTDAVDGPLAQVLLARADVLPLLLEILDDPSVDGTQACLRALASEKPLEFDRLTTVVAGSYYLDASVRRTIGYDGPRPRSGPFPEMDPADVALARDVARPLTPRPWN